MFIKYYGGKWVVKRCIDCEIGECGNKQTAVFKAALVDLWENQPASTTSVHAGKSGCSNYISGQQQQCGTAANNAGWGH